MSLEQIHYKLKVSVWQGMVQSGIDLSKIPEDQHEKLVNAITNNVAHTINDLLDDLTPTVKVDVDEKNNQKDNGEETIIWEGRPFLSLIESYSVTNERIMVRKGLVGRDVEIFELIRVQDIDWSQAMGERILGIGDISIHGADASGSNIVLRNIKDPEIVYEKLRKAWLAARKKYGLIFREEM